FFVLDLIKKDEQIRGVIAYNLADGSVHRFNSAAVLLATGGCGQLFNPTSNSKSSTGDGLALALNCNLSLQDMEFMQFHPTGLYKTGFLVTESARGAGGILKNGNNERFMKNYAPDKLELAERDTVARAIFSEIKAGRGINEKNHVHLDLTAVEDLQKRLPEVFDLTTNYLGINPTRTPIAVSPTAHYLMGGIPTDLNGKVTGADEVKGLYAAGECACLSLHGANRLGGNSLLEINVMGARVGKTLAQETANKIPPASNQNLLEKWKNKIVTLKNNNGDFTPSGLKKELQQVMSKNAGGQCSTRSLKRAQNKINTLEEKYNQIKIPDCSGHYNYPLVETLELKNLLRTAKIMVTAATGREESRGAHWRANHPRTDNKEWQKHSLAKIEKNRPKMDYKPA
ncbi:MAG: FAD-binding protein, partial [bacterium]